MIVSGTDRVRACFANIEEIFSDGDPLNREEVSFNTPSRYLPQMPQQQTTACRALTDQEDAFEERAAIMEYDGGLPRMLAEFLAKNGLIGL